MLAPLAFEFDVYVIRLVRKQGSAGIIAVEAAPLPHFSLALRDQDAGQSPLVLDADQAPGGIDR